MDHLESITRLRISEVYSKQLFLAIPGTEAQRLQVQGSEFQFLGYQGQMKICFV